MQKKIKTQSCTKLCMQQYYYYKRGKGVRSVRPSVRSVSNMKAGGVWLLFIANLSLQKQCNIFVNFDFRLAEISQTNIDLSGNTLLDSIFQLYVMPYNFSTTSYTESISKRITLTYSTIHTITFLSSIEKEIFYVRTFLNNFLTTVKS